MTAFEPPLTFANSSLTSTGHTKAAVYSQLHQQAGQTTAPDQKCKTSNLLDNAGAIHRGKSTSVGCNAETDIRTGLSIGNALLRT